MKLLFLTPQLPFPPEKGTTIRNFHLIRELAANNDIALLSFVRSEEEMARVPELLSYCRSVDTVLAPQRTIWDRAVTTLTAPLPDMAFRLRSPEFLTKLDEVLDRVRPDIVQVEGIEMAEYGLWIKGYHVDGSPRQVDHVPSVRTPYVVFDDHNAEYRIQQRAWEIDRHSIRAWHKALYSFIQWRKLRRYEAMVCRLADAVIAVSDRDKEAIQAVAPDVRIHVVPNGVDNAFFSRFIPHESYVTARHVITHMSSLAFAGTMDYRPNVDAMLWFYHEILPLIKKDCFNVHLYIVGRSPVKEIMRLAIDPAITVTGYVNDIRPYIAHSRVFVVPIRMGSGTKLKVLQAMAMGVPVVSTSLGAEGIKVTDGENILIADTPAEFAQKVLLLLQDERQRQIISRNARQLVEEYYDWSVVVPRLHAVYEDLPTRPRR